MVKFSKTDQIPCRYGLDEFPAAITPQELLYFLSFNPSEILFILSEIDKWSRVRYG